MLYFLSVSVYVREVMIILVSPSLLGDFKLAGEELFQDFELAVCFFSWRILANDAIKVPLDICRLVCKMEVNAAGVCPVVQLEVEKQEQLAQHPQAWTCNIYWRRLSVDK